MNYQYIYISFIISTIFFILQHIINKNTPSSDKNFNKKTLKDSIYIFIISIVILHANEYYNSTQEIKTKVFTSEPSF